MRAQRSLTHRQYLLCLSLITLLTALYFATWAVLAHPYRAPDEPHHSNSVIRLLHGGGWPAPGEARFGPGVEIALHESSYSTRLPGSSRSVPGPTTPELVDRTPVPDTERSAITDDNALQRPSSRVPDQMTQHPPLYYAVVAAVLKVAGLAEARWDVQLAGMRLVSAALMTPLPALIASAVRRVYRSRPLAASAACVPLLVPEVGHIAGSVSNDVMATLTGALTTLACLGVISGDLRYRRSVLVGVALGCGLLTKGFLLAAIPLVAMAYLLARGPLTHRLWRGLTALVVAFVVGGWWWLRNLVVHGSLQPAGQTAPTVNEAADRSVAAYLDRAWGTLTQTFWGSFSWNELNVAPGFVAVATAAALTLIVLGAATARTAWREVVALSAFVVLVIGAVVVRQYNFYVEFGVFAGLQGRYFYVALLGLAVLTAGGVWSVLRRSETVATIAVPVVVVLAVAVAAYALTVALRGFYLAPGEPWEAALARWAGWSPASSELLGVTLVALALAALAAVGVAAWSAVRGAPTGTSGQARHGARRHAR
ncbi:DUF2142 domain-containing protein [Georgenia sp. H159]|uniref:DUF2142 domain-containing protein n=1 Tax=Georgenia sp. H159 TaxID=3076115 RepID=UPI002D783F44|nr:DUF2142 domain-containing protein [Georgenia sp. H159]